MFICTNNIADIISSQFGIYTEDTTIYFCINSKSGSPPEKVKLLAILENDLQSVVNWNKQCFVNFNAFKSKLVFFSYHRVLLLASIIMINTNLRGATY